MPLRDRQSLAVAVARLQERTPYRAPRPVAVYVIKLGTIYKIGLSMNPQQRIKAMMLPEQPEFVRLYWLDRAREFERAIHKKYAKWREYGEWFQIPVEVIPEIDAYAEDWKKRK